MIPEKKDYSELTLEDLRKEEKIVKKNLRFSEIFIGFLIGVIAFGVAKDGSGLFYTFIPIVLIAITYKNSKNLQNNLSTIRAEIEKREMSEGQSPMMLS